MAPASALRIRPNSTCTSSGGLPAASPMARSLPTKRFIPSSPWLPLPYLYYSIHYCTLGNGRSYCMCHGSIALLYPRLHRPPRSGRQEGRKDNCANSVATDCADEEDQPVRPKRAGLEARVIQEAPQLVGFEEAEAARSEDPLEAAPAKAPGPEDAH